MKIVATTFLILAFSALFVLGEQRWDFTAGTENWTSSGMTGLSASGGILSATSSGGDPYFMSPTALSVNLSGITQVRLRFKNPSVVANAAIYFTTAADPSFVGNFVSFPVSTGDTDFHEYTVTMSGHADWGVIGNAPPSGVTGPNIVMILADDLGWNDTSLNGAGFYKTPNVQRLANRGMRFHQRLLSHPPCSPIRSSRTSPSPIPPPPFRRSPCG